MQVWPDHVFSVLHSRMAVQQPRGLDQLPQHLIDRVLSADCFSPEDFGQIRLVSKSWHAKVRCPGAVSWRELSKLEDVSKLMPHVASLSLKDTKCCELVFLPSHPQIVSSMLR